MKHRGAHLPVQGGWRRGVYTKSRIFRMQDKKRELRSCGFSSLTKGGQQVLSRSSSVYLITLSALASTFGGIVRPICLAALRLMINSNFFGCSTGRLAGLAPFKILSTYVAARRNKSVMFAL